MMPNDVFTLERLLSPIDLDTFFEEYWEKKPLLVSERDPDYYADLMTLEDVDNLVFYGKQDPSKDVRFVKGMEPPYRNYLRPEMPFINQAYAAYNEGYTIVVNEVHKRHKPMTLFLKELERLCSLTVASNLYLTPANSQGFKAHYDTHDIFIVQVYGAKRWTVYDAFMQKLPPRTDGVPIPDQHLPSEWLYDVTLKAGDLLYMPRGFVHNARSEEESSVHLSVGLYNFRWSDLLERTLTVLSRENVRFRESLPPGFLNREDAFEEARTRFKEMLDLFVNEANFEKGIQLLSEDLILNRPSVPDGHFAQLDKLDEITLDTVLTKREGILYRVTTEGRFATIQFSGNMLRMPRKVELALHFVKDLEQFSVSDMPGLADKEKLVLARHLVKEGFLKAI